jgi:hypothetical protein
LQHAFAFTTNVGLLPSASDDEAAINAEARARVIESALSLVISSLLREESGENKSEEATKKSFAIIIGTPDLRGSLTQSSAVVQLI